MPTMKRTEQSSHNYSTTLPERITLLDCIRLEANKQMAIHEHRRQSHSVEASTCRTRVSRQQLQDAVEAAIAILDNESFDFSE